MAEPELRVVEDVAAAADEVVAQDPHTLVLAGGRTPLGMYRRLAGSELDWAGIDVWFGDERCVPPDHPQSNFRMAQESLLAQVPVRVHRMLGEQCDAEAYERELRAAFGPSLPAFDVVVLGLGADGHTASLFPGDPALDERERWVLRVEHDGLARLTLTLQVLSAARTALFLVAGEEKRDALHALLAGDQEIPAARVSAERVIVYADRAAAGEAPGG